MHVISNFLRFFYISFIIFMPMSVNAYMSKYNCKYHFHEDLLLRSFACKFQVIWAFPERCLNLYQHQSRYWVENEIPIWAFYQSLNNLTFCVYNILCITYNVLQSKCYWYKNMLLSKIGFQICFCYCKIAPWVFPIILLDMILRYRKILREAFHPIPVL